MVNKTSSALLLYKTDDFGLELFIGHMGGPFWARKDNGGWSIPKGEQDDQEENLLDLALREFKEEIGVEPPECEYMRLGDFKQPSGKTIVTYIGEVAEKLEFRVSNTFEMEWPKGSGKIVDFPEIDRAAWYSVRAAKEKVVKGQIPIIEALESELLRTGRISSADSRIEEKEHRLF